MGRSPTLRIILPVINPIFDLEVRRRFRHRRTYVILVAYLGMLGLGLWLAYAVRHGLSGRPGLSSLPVGKVMLATTFFIQVAWLCLFVPGLVAGSIAGERERQTFDLLLTTPLGPGRIVRGKFAAGFGLVALFLLAALPLLSLSFLMGAVAAEEVLVAAAILAALAAALCGVGLLTSALVRSSILATLMAHALVFLGLVVAPSVFGICFLLAGFSNNGPDGMARLRSTLGVLITLASLHPVSAAVLTEIAWVSGLSLWWPEWPVGNLRVGTPGPWLVFCLTYTLVGLGCLWAAARRCRP